LRISKKGMIFKTYEGQLNVQTFGHSKVQIPSWRHLIFLCQSMMRR
jgi:hypothetical protein